MSGYPVDLMISVSAVRDPESTAQSRIVIDFPSTAMLSMLGFYGSIVQPSPASFSVSSKRFGKLSASTYPIVIDDDSSCHF